MTRPSSHSVLPESLLTVVRSQLNYKQVKGGVEKATRVVHSVVAVKRARFSSVIDAIHQSGEEKNEKGLEESARSQAGVIATVFIIVAHSSALCTDGPSAF